jgi:hypothetical protein
VITLSCSVYGTERGTAEFVRSHEQDPIRSRRRRWDGRQSTDGPWRAEWWEIQSTREEGRHRGDAGTSVRVGGRRTISISSIFVLLYPPVPPPYSPPPHLAAALQPSTCPRKLELKKRKRSDYNFIPLPSLASTPHSLLVIDLVLQLSNPLIVRRQLIHSIFNQQTECPLSEGRFAVFFHDVQVRL